DILPDTGQYTIALLARLNAVSADGYSKLIDFDNGAADPGLYNYFGHLIFYGYSAGGNQVVIGPDYADIVLTRDKSGAIAGYDGGKLQFAITDLPGNKAVVIASDILRFFIDDGFSGGTENSSGAVARIRVWNGALDAADVLELTDTIFHDG